MDDDTIEARFELHDERLDHYSERLEALEAAKQQRHGRALEYVVIALVALEAAFEILMYFHPHA